MSWSANYIGSPDKIVEALKKQSEDLGKNGGGKSKEEFDSALPHLIGLVEQNHNKSYPPVLQLNASGHGSVDYNYCTANIQNLGGTLV